MNCIEKLISDSNLDGFKKRRALRELAERKPPHITPAERERVGELAEKITKIKTEWLGFESKLKRFQTDFTACLAEQHRLKNTLDPDDTDGINRLTFLSTKLVVLNAFTGRAGSRQTEMQNDAANHFRCLDAILTRYFGKSTTGSFFSSSVFGELPSRLDLALAELGELLK